MRLHMFAYTSLMKSRHAGGVALMISGSEKSTKSELQSVRPLPTAINLNMHIQIRSTPPAGGSHTVTAWCGWKEWEVDLARVDQSSTHTHT